MALTWDGPPEQPIMKHDTKKVFTVHLECNAITYTTMEVEADNIDRAYNIAIAELDKVHPRVFTSAGNLVIDSDTVLVSGWHRGVILS